MGGGVRVEGADGWCRWEGRGVRRRCDGSFLRLLGMFREAARRTWQRGACTAQVKTGAYPTAVGGGELRRHCRACERQETREHHA